VIVYWKGHNGEWNRTGERLPTETIVTIACNAEPPNKKVTYTYDQAEDLIKGWIERKVLPYDYRYEIAGASAKSKKGKK